MPKVSIILTSYNHDKYIRESIDSALSQTVNDFELIIWDDASSDNSWAIINSYSDPRIKSFRNDETRRGIHGLNRAIADVVTGEYVAIHHSDDVWEKEKLKKQVDYLDEHPDIGAVFTNALAIGEDGDPLRDPGHPYSKIFDQPNRNRQQWLHHFFYHGNALCHPSVLIRKQCYELCGKYRYGLAQLCDLDMWMRLCARYEIHVLPEKLVSFRIRANEANTSGNRRESRIRSLTEFHNLLNNYLDIETFKEMVAIFPEADKYYRPNGFEPKFVFAMVSLRDDLTRWVKLFGIDLLFELIGDVRKASTIKSLYGFDYRDLIKLTKKHDLFSVEPNPETSGKIVSLNKAVEKRKDQIISLDMEVANREDQIINLNMELAKRDGQIINLDTKVAKRDGQIISLNTEVAKRDGKITKLKQAIDERDDEIVRQNNQLVDYESTQKLLQLKQAEIDSIYASALGKSIVRIRRYRLILNEAYWMIRRPISLKIRSVWIKLPFSVEKKLLIKNKLFQLCPWPFKHTAAYQAWQQANTYIHSQKPKYDLINGGPLNEESKKRIYDEIDRFENRPLISILMPVYNVDVRYLTEAIESIQNQLYENWELCICDDGSSKTKIISKLKELAVTEERIKLVFSNKNQGISAATNKCLEIANGEYIAPLDHDDLLTINALFEFVQKLNNYPDVDVIYSDQDKIDATGNLSEPFHKPAWSPEYFRGVMYIGHLLMVRKAVAEAVGGFYSKYDKVQDYEFMLRVSEQTDKIVHIPKILYHWRAIKGSLAFGANEKSDIENLQANAVNDHLWRLKIPATAKSHETHNHRVVIEPKSRASSPLVSIIITTKDAPDHIGRCLKSIFQRTTYKNFEVIVVDNETTDVIALEHINKHPVNVVKYEKSFNFSEANNMGVKKAKGRYLILLNNDTEVITPEWIEHLLLYAEQPDVGAVGPLLIYPDSTVQHAGVVLGFRGTADHVMRGFPKASDGYAGSLACAREVSGVTGACMMVSHKNYVDLGGLVEYYATHYQDVDLCLRLVKKGLRNIFVPRATLVHHESTSRKTFYDMIDRALLLDSWDDYIAEGDRYYNRNFSLNHTNYTLEIQ